MQKKQTSRIHFGYNLRLGKKKFYSNEDGTLCAVLLVSKVYPRAKGISEYWYSIHKYQIDEIRNHKLGYYAFCMSVDKKVMIIDC